MTEEPHWPYERPPLSKDYLAKKKPFEKILLQEERFWSQRDITLLRSTRIDRVDPIAHAAHADTNGVIGYGTLVWAAGGAPRRLVCSGHDLAGVHAVRTRNDVDQLQRELSEVFRVVVIGGGYIGLEVAAVLIKLGKSVTVVEMQDRVLARVAGEPLSRFYEAEHRARGVDIRLETAVRCIEEQDGRASGVRLGDDTVLLADMVIVGIGIIPSVQPLLDAGAEGDNGLDVDAYCRTTLPDVYAIGDCAAHVNQYADGRRIRLESVQNAVDQADVAARSITGGAMPYKALPWFWSNQYDLRLQTVGLSIGHDDTVIRGDPETRSFSVVYLREGQVIALDCINMTRDFVQGKLLVTGKAQVDAALLRDVAVPLKSHVTATLDVNPASIVGG